MFLFNMQEKIQYILQGENVWKVALNGRFYSVNTLGKKILQLIVEGYSNHEISSELRLQGYGNIDSKQIQPIRESIGRGEKKRSTPIRFRITILELKHFQKMLSRFDFLFNWYAVSVFLFIFFLLFLLQYNKLIDSFHQSNITVGGISTSVFITLFILLFHEFGHAASSLKYKVPPTEIGFGVYLYFPVLFTDVSHSWMASRFQRIVIDLSGAYFQFILLTLFLFFNYFIDFPSYVVNAFVINNVGIMIYNLNPLFKFDGYWLFCDLFNISNLRAKSLNALAELIYKKFNGVRFIKSRRYSVSIYVYSIVSVSFLLFIVFSFISFIVKNTISFFQLFSYGNLKFEVVLWGMTKVFILFGGGYLSVSALFKTILTIRQNVLRLYAENR